MTLGVTHYGDAAEVLREAGAFLEARPDEHNLILTLLHDRAETGESGRYWLVRDGADAVGLVLQSPIGFRAAITPMTTDATRAAVEAIAGSGVDLPGVEGEAASAATFAGHWSQVRRTGASPALGTRLMALGSLTLPPGIAGRGRLAGTPDFGLVSNWVKAFADELGEHRAPGAG